MLARFLLDTNMASYVIKGNIPRVRERLLRVPMAEVGISVVTKAELRFGVVRKPEAVRLKTAVEEFLLRVEVLPWDSESAQALCSGSCRPRTYRRADGQSRHDDRRPGSGRSSRAGHT